MAAVVNAHGLRVAVGGWVTGPTPANLRCRAPRADEELNELAWSLDVRDDPHQCGRAAICCATLARQAIQHKHGDKHEYPVLGRDALHTVHSPQRPRTPWPASCACCQRFSAARTRRDGHHVGCEHGVCGACTVRIDGVAARLSDLGGAG